MTAQAVDKIIYKGEDYVLLGIVGEELPKPQDFGIVPHGIKTSCYRGFFSTFEIAEDGIYLKEMTVYGTSVSYKPINGVLPKVDDLNKAVYKGINLPVRFTGMIRLGMGFLMDYYVPMGFQKPSAFKTVIDLKFANGLVVETKDRSDEVEAIRERFKKRYESGGIFRLWKFIKEAFSQDMDDLK